jgi:hypothetical protein
MTWGIYIADIPAWRLHGKSRVPLTEEAPVPLNLNDVRRIATEVVEATDSSLRVVGAATAEGGSNYTEIMLSVTNCHAEPCRLSIGVEREMSEAAFRKAVGEQVRLHIHNRETAAR